MLPGAGRSDRVRAILRNTAKKRASQAWALAGPSSPSSGNGDCATNGSQRPARADTAESRSTSSLNAPRAALPDGRRAVSQTHAAVALTTRRLMQPFRPSLNQPVPATFLVRKPPASISQPRRQSLPCCSKHTQSPQALPHRPTGSFRFHSLRRVHSSRTGHFDPTGSLQSTEWRPTANSSISPHDINSFRMISVISGVRIT